MCDWKCDIKVILLGEVEHVALDWIVVGQLSEFYESTY
jgi:hypothetical protein